MIKQIYRVGLAILLIAGAGVVTGQDLSQVEVKVHPVAGNVYMLTGAGGNIGVSAGPDGLLMVDDQYEPLADKIKAALAGLESGELKFILNTHYHGDHTGGNAVFGREAPIISHRNVRRRLATEQNIMGHKVPPQSEEAWPVITFDGSLSIHFNGEEIEVIHLPHGHTDGDAVIFFTKSNVVHMGDLLFAGMFPFVDLGAGGDVEGCIKNIETVLSRLPADAKVIPGHGPLSTVEDLKKNRYMLVETTGFIRAGIEAGKNLEQLQSEGLPEQWKSWAWNFIPEKTWIEIIYKSLSASD